VVPQVGGEERVDPGATYLVEEAVAGAAADGDSADHRLRVARDPQPRRGARQAVGGTVGELGERQRLVEFADPAEAPASRGVVRIGHERAGDAQSDALAAAVGLRITGA